MPQHIYLFEDTLRNNLLVAQPDADTNQLMHVCEVAGLTSFIENSENGLDTWLGETGTKISSGQARASRYSQSVIKTFRTSDPG